MLTLLWESVSLGLWLIFPRSYMSASASMIRFFHLAFDIAGLVWGCIYLLLTVHLGAVEYRWCSCVSVSQGNGSGLKARAVLRNHLVGLVWKWGPPASLIRQMPVVSGNKKQNKTKQENQPHLTPMWRAKIRTSYEYKWVEWTRTEREMNQASRVPDNLSRTRLFRIELAHSRRLINEWTN